jgi:hypothetical protein
VLQTILKHVTTYERHESLTAFHNAIATKLFFALYLNTGLTVLLVNAKLSGAPSGIGILSGDFTDFSPKWFAGTLELGSIVSY